jgi:hypothetical protein
MRGVWDCPNCGSTRVAEYMVGESHSCGHDYEYYEMGCADCNAEWLLGYEDGKWYVYGDDDYEEVA